MKGDYAELYKRISAADRAQLERHLAGIREIETDLDALAQPQPAPGASCTKPMDAWIVGSTYADNSNKTNGVLDKWTKQFLDLSAAALAIFLAFGRG